MARYVYREGIGVVPVEEQQKPSDGLHYVIGDNMDHLRSDINGLYYTSKSKFEQHVRDHGAVIIGNQDIRPLTTKKRFSTKPLDVRGAWEKATRRVMYKND